jgi:hypothetical protein
MTDVLRTLTMPRWRLALRVLMLVLIVAVGVRLGVFWGFLVFGGGLLIWAFWYDFTHKPRGGWRPAPMGSFAVTNNAHPTFLISERGDSVVDPTGGTYEGSSRVPTPEEQAAMGDGRAGGLLGLVVELAVLVIAIFLLAIS